MLKSVTQSCKDGVTRARAAWFVLCFSIMALFVPTAAMATETETEKKVGEIATSVSSEGVVIVLAILSALVTLLVAIIIIPKAIGLIRRFI